MIRIQPSVFLMAAFLTLLIPFNWLFSVILASVFHETGHFAAICMTGGKVESVTVSFTGIQIHSAILHRRNELICAAAGPLASMLLLVFSHSVPKLAICGAVQGMFNLLPVYPMDGGRMLNCLVQWLLPGRADRICKAAEHLILLIFLVISMIALYRFRGGLLSVICILTAFTRLLSGKIPCKSGEIAVQ